MMRNSILMAIVLVGLLMLSGCIVGPYEIRGEEMLTLNSALSLANGYLEDLWTLWSQAPTKDKIIIEGEILNVALRNQGGYGLMAAEKLSKVALNDEIRSSAKNALLKYKQAQEEDAKLTREEKAQELEKIQRNISFLHKLQKKYSQEPKSRQLEIQEKSEQEARELEEKKRKEEICLAIKESRKQLFQEAGGRLDDKSAEQVKGLIDSWRQEEKRWFLNQKDYSEFFGKTDFYKAFGQPDKKQLISNYYYFYYACKDGTVQLEIDADSLSEENIIRVSEMNIF